MAGWTDFMFHLIEGAVPGGGKPSKGRKKGKEPVVDDDRVSLVVKTLSEAAKWDGVSLEEWLGVWEKVVLLYDAGTAYTRDMVKGALDAVWEARGGEPLREGMRSVVATPQHPLRVAVFVKDPAGYAEHAEEVFDEVVEMGLKNGALPAPVTLFRDGMSRWKDRVEASRCSPELGLTVDGHLSDAFIERALCDNTRGARRVGAELLRRKREGETWWSKWYAAFTVISDEQPWHLVGPVWSSDLAAVPSPWLSCLLSRASRHSDPRVVRKVVKDVFEGYSLHQIEATVLQDLLPAACRLLTTPTDDGKYWGRLFRSLLLPVVERLRHLPPAPVPVSLLPAECDDPQRYLSALADICEAWRAAGVAEVDVCVAKAIEVTTHLTEAHTMAPDVVRALLCHKDSAVLVGIPPATRESLATRATPELAVLLAPEVVQRTLSARLEGLTPIARLKVLADVSDVLKVVAHESHITVGGVDVTRSMFDTPVSSRDEAVAFAVLARHAGSALAHDLLSSVLRRTEGPLLNPYVAALVPAGATAPLLPDLVALLTAPRPSSPVEIKSLLDIFTGVVESSMGWDGAGDWLLGMLEHVATTKLVANKIVVGSVLRGVRACFAAGRGSPAMVEAGWKVVQGMKKSREAVRDFLSIVPPEWIAEHRESLAASSLLASESVCYVTDTDVLGYLVVHSVAPKNTALHPSHPAVAACTTSPSSELLEAVLRHAPVTCDDAVEGSAVQQSRVRAWWAIAMLLPVAHPSLLSRVGERVWVELESTSLVPSTRMLVQEVGAILARLHPPALETVLNVLRSPKAKTRTAVSALAMVAHLFLLHPTDLDTSSLLGVVTPWALSLPHASRTTAQSILAHVLRDDTDHPFLPFLHENPHLRALTDGDPMGRLRSYLGEAPLPFNPPPSLDFMVAKALQRVQTHYADIEGSALSHATPAAGWARKGARRCPARASSHKPDEEGEGESVEDDEETPLERVEVDFQCRPAPGRHKLAVTGEASICVVGSLLDNLPNQAGLSRTLEAFFGTRAELALPSAKVVRDPAFMRMSMASEQWLRIVEVPPGDRMLAYLRMKRAEGYEIVALEQTKNSVRATEYEFKEKTVLIVGNEQLGCPAWLLGEQGLVHTFVELPLHGASRSLNAHVTGATMLWQYMLQHP
eukprot:Sspe_Gene.67113::Locus_39627_Transcript_1_1_Confidence_1.000_Length_3824::g.67113::m.67113/K15333/TRM3, TARBP1; tRNA guanosine-2'-O-methyltransferase